MKRTFLVTMLMALGLQSAPSIAQVLKEDLGKRGVLKELERGSIKIEARSARADGAGNGGDICENRIKIIRDDIESWILKDGSKPLNLPSSISHEEYDSGMLEELRASHSISCTQGPVLIGGSEKTCKNYEDSSGIKRIKCNLKRFSELSEENQYKLIHHEYAGLAGFEVNNGEESNYFISNQLSAYLENQVVKRLVIKRIVDLDIELVPIFGDTFMMGSPEEEVGKSSDEKQRSVTIDYNFEMMTTEVNQDLYMKVTGVNPSYFKKEKDCPDTYKVIETDEGGLDSLCPNHPVENVSFKQVGSFLALLNAKTGMNYRLPTEAEWELAARAGRQTAYSFGNNDTFLSEYGIYSSNSRSQTQPVGPMRSYANNPNRNGLHDMHGNVWEWTQDWYIKSPFGGVNPTGPTTGSYRVVRGGSWFSNARYLRSANRDGNTPSYRGNYLGFRLVRTLH